MQKDFEARIISIRDNSEYLDRTVQYLSEKWGISRVVYYIAFQTVLLHKALSPAGIYSLIIRE